MPTQKIHSLPRTGKQNSEEYSEINVIKLCSELNFFLSLGPPSCENQHGRLSSAHRMSDPVNSPISHKKLHTELTQRLQKVLNERNKDQAHQESAAAQKHMSDTRENCTSKSSVEQSAPKEQNVQRNGVAEQKNRRQMSGEKDAVAVKAPATNSTGKEKILSSAKSETKKALSKKEKVRNLMAFCNSIAFCYVFMPSLFCLCSERCSGCGQHGEAYLKSL